MCIFFMAKKKNADGIRCKNWFIRQQEINFWILITRILTALLQMHEEIVRAAEGHCVYGRL